MSKKYILSKILDEDGKFETGYSFIERSREDSFIRDANGENLVNLTDNFVRTGVVIDGMDEITTINVSSILVGYNHGKDIIAAPLKAIELGAFYIAYKVAKKDGLFNL